LADRLIDGYSASVAAINDSTAAAAAAAQPSRYLRSSKQGILFSSKM
jgi:hypothetical protein